MKSGTQSVEQYYRYCPDAPQIQISDSVCFGRQRVSYPPCKDCQFNHANQERQPGMEFFDLLPASRRKESPSMMDSLFKAYDVRAKYPEPLDEEAAWSIGNATAQFLRTSLKEWNGAVRKRTRWWWVATCVAAVRRCAALSLRVRGRRVRT
jgi:hypothetical protein